MKAHIINLSQFVVDILADCIHYHYTVCMQYIHGWLFWAIFFRQPTHVTLPQHCLLKIIEMKKMTGIPQIDVFQCTNAFIFISFCT